MGDRHVSDQVISLNPDWLISFTGIRTDALTLILRGFERLGAVLTPTYEDWVLAGRLLEQYQRLYGGINPSEHAHDVLIVLSAAQVQGVVVTANLRHMERWARLARRSGRPVRVHAVP